MLVNDCAPETYDNFTCVAAPSYNETCANFTALAPVLVRLQPLEDAVSDTPFEIRFEGYGLAATDTVFLTTDNGCPWQSWVCAPLALRFVGGGSEIWANGPPRRVSGLPSHGKRVD